MSYIGNTPAESYASFERQVFTIVNSQTAYTLNHAVTNENEIRLVVNNVVQEPGSGKAFTASGTTLTLSAALVNGTDEMYCVFLGRALQSVIPPASSVGNSQVASTIITGQTALGATPADTDELLISDAGTLKRVDFSHLKVANTPAFEAYLGGSGGQSISDNTVTKVQCQTEVYDTDSAYDNSTNYRFTPQTAGKYLVYASIQNEGGGNSNLAESFLYIKKNGSSNILETQNDYSANPGRSDVIFNSMIVDMNGSSDYVELYGRINSEDGSGQLFESDSQFARATRFGAYRIIT